MNILNKYFDKVFCITRPEDVNRHINCKNQFSQFNVEYEFVPAVDSGFLQSFPPKEGCNKVSQSELSLTIAHMMCLQKAKLHGFKKIVILEDDFKFLEDWDVRMVSFLSELPEKWKLLYMGRPEWSVGIFDMKTKYFSENVSVCKYGCASHFMGINETAFDECIKLMKSLTDAVDIYYNCIMDTSDLCFTFSNKNFADAISLPHKKYHSQIRNFNLLNYIPSSLRDESFHP